MSEHRISSQTSTGGTGIFFEHHVGAFFLALLLIRGIPPILKDCYVDKVCFQNNHLGWATDDLLIEGITDSGDRRTLFIQAKLSFKISKQDEKCKKVFVNFWRDFVKHGKYDNSYRLALAIRRGTDALLKTFNSLLDCARGSSTFEDFFQRLSADRYISIDAKKQASTVRAIIEEYENKTILDDDFWQFLKMIYILSLIFLLRLLSMKPI